MFNSKTTNFQKIESRICITPICRMCGKKVRRILSEYQTINPWNRKEPAQIRKENYEQLKEMEKKLDQGGVICRRCENDVI